MAVSKHVEHEGKLVRNQNVYEVEKVIGHREVFQGAKSTDEYLVLWLGYSVEDASWQPWKNLRSCMQLVHDYHDRNSRMVNKRFPHHVQTHRMSLRRTSEDAAAANLSAEEDSLHKDWEIEDILGHQILEHAKEGKKMHYLVKWVGLHEPIWSEEKRVLKYDSKGGLQTYINKEVLFGEMLGEGSNIISLGESKDI